MSFFTSSGSTSGEGRFEASDKGTLFLDEVGNLSYENQVRLLRVLQEGQIQRLGDEKTIKVDVRVVAATNANNQEESSYQQENSTEDIGLSE